MSAPFVYKTRGRRKRTLVVLLAVWGALALVWLQLEAAWWIIAFLAAFTLPAVYDLWADPVSGLRLGAETMEWYSGQRRAALDLSEVDHVRLDTRLDFSVRATVVLTSGRKLRLPYEATPPDAPFEAALHLRGITTRRFHFQLLQ